MINLDLAVIIDSTYIVLSMIIGFYAYKMRLSSSLQSVASHLCVAGVVGMIARDALLRGDAFYIFYALIDAVCLIALLNVRNVSSKTIYMLTVSSVMFTVFVYFVMHAIIVRASLYDTYFNDFYAISIVVVNALRVFLLAAWAKYDYHNNL